ALVGHSGSGKTTLAGLLPRFYLHSEGQILLDGHELEDYQLENLRQQIALVSQDVVLFNDTIAGNIAYGALAGIDRAAVLAAAQAAHAMEFIEQLPEGLDTRLGEHGTLLSGGQRQRLAIARALLKDAPILILDEATSALDSESERAIQEALKQVMKNRTTLVIAHRLSTIENADQVIVLRSGKVVEFGTHDELLAKGRVYANLYYTQFGEH
ncbi:MAG: ATP-binding cassette domain-containing protein, partial [Xanthomonadales bacterium]|nr:ATP-binding cassette domain-containing protein [Xanthomonadales bacterium]